VLEDNAGVICALDFGVEESATLAEGGNSDAAGVGKTVVYSVFVTTRRDVVVVTNSSDDGVAELDDRSDETPELIGAAESDACVADATTDELLTSIALVELINVLLRILVPRDAPG
jgi:hypothetical protein